MSTYNLHYASCRQAYPWSERRPCLEKQNEYITENTHSYLPERNVKQYELN